MVASPCLQKANLDSNMEGLLKSPHPVLKVDHCWEESPFSFHFNYFMYVAILPACVSVNMPDPMELEVHTIVEIKPRNDR